MLLVSAVLLACGPRPPHQDARSRFLFWAKYVSREARSATLAATAAATTAATAPNVDDEVEVLRRRLHISDRELKAILAEAQTEKWAESPRCQPAPEPYFLNGLLLRPQPLEPVEGRQSAETCARRLQGVVIVEAVIGANGAATGITVSKGIDPVLDRQAVTTLESTAWLPALLCARPVAVHYTLAMPFRLSSCSSPGSSSSRTPGEPAVPHA